MLSLTIALLLSIGNPNPAIGTGLPPARELLPGVVTRDFIPGPPPIPGQDCSPAEDKASVGDKPWSLLDYPLSVRIFLWAWSMVALWLPFRDFLREKL